MRKAIAALGMAICVSSPAIADDLNDMETGLVFLLKLNGLEFIFQEYATCRTKCLHIDSEDMSKKCRMLCVKSSATAAKRALAD